MPNRPQRKQLAPRDMMIVALAILVITRIDWGNLNSFHFLILFLMFLMLMLRWANMRKEAVRKQAMERYREQYEPDAANKSAFQWADSPAETAAAEDVVVESAAVAVEEAPAAEPVVAEEIPAEEKTEE